MPPSIRRQRADVKNRDARDADQQRRRRLAAEEFRSNSSATIRAVSESLRLSHGTVQSIRFAVKSNNEEALQKLLDPRQNRAGRKQVLTREEEDMISKSIVRFGASGRALNIQKVREIMGLISSDGRKHSYQNGMPSAEAVRSFRARRFELTCRKAEDKDAVKIRAESYEHVKSLAEVLKSVFEKHPGLPKDAEAIINLDETEVNADSGGTQRVLGGKGPHECRRGRKSRGGPHVTAILAVSAAGRKAPPFFLVAGKHTRTTWTDPLDQEKFKENGAPDRYARLGWFPKDAALFTSANGSMEMSHMHLLVEHVNRYFRKFVPLPDPLLILLDGHSSRNGCHWVHKAQEFSIEVVQSPANTSHFLQPCDQSVNKIFKKEMRKKRDQLCAIHPLVNTSTQQFKLVCATHAYGAITENDIKHSFEVTGLWPMDFRFLERLKRPRHMVTETAEDTVRSATFGPSTRKMNARKRKSDQETWVELRKILEDRSKDPSEKIQSASIVLRNNTTVNEILLRAEGSHIDEGNGQSKSRRRTGSALPGEQPSGGAPALYLTHADRLKLLLLNAEKSLKEQGKKRKRSRAIKSSQRNNAEITSLVDPLDQTDLSPSRAVLGQKKSLSSDYGQLQRGGEFQTSKRLKRGTVHKKSGMSTRSASKHLTSSLINKDTSHNTQTFEDTNFVDPTPRKVLEIGETSPSPVRKPENKPDPSSQQNTTPRCLQSLPSRNIILSPKVFPRILASKNVPVSRPESPASISQKKGNCRIVKFRLSMSGRRFMGSGCSKEGKENSPPSSGISNIVSAHYGRREGI